MSVVQIHGKEVLFVWDAALESKYCYITQLQFINSALQLLHAFSVAVRFMLFALAEWLLLGSLCSAHAHLPSNTPPASRSSAGGRQMQHVHGYHFIHITRLAVPQTIRPAPASALLGLQQHVRYLATRAWAAC